jgi:cysteine desulfurase
MIKRIYLDYNATTPVDSRVLEKMYPYFATEFGNASSQHPFGWVAQKAVEQARTQVSDLLGAPSSKDIIFTSGASESNTLAIVGLAQKLLKQKQEQKAHFITSTAEHHSVLESMHAAEQLGIEVTYLPVNKFGQIEIETIKNAIQPHTVLLSFMWANNEVGSFNPIKAIADLAAEKNLIFHTDATQACGKVNINLKELKIDLLSLSAHKIYGPKGVGALYIHKNLSESLSLSPIIFGGSQERGFRAGTLNVPGIVGLGKACEIANFEMPIELNRLNEYTQKIWSSLNSFYPKIEWNGHPSERLGGQMNFLFRDKRMDQILPRMVNLSMSSGSACASRSNSVSHVLQAMGLKREEILASVRLSVGRTTTLEEVEETCRILKEHL